MRRKKVRTFYGKMKFDDLHTLAGKVVDCMKDSTVFIDPPLSLRELERLALDYQTKWEVAKNAGSKLENTLRNEAKAALVEVFSRLRLCIMYLRVLEMLQGPAIGRR